MPCTRAVHPYPCLRSGRPAMYSHAPQLPEDATPDSSCTPLGARIPGRFGAVLATRASWVARFQRFRDTHWAAIVPDHRAPLMHEIAQRGLAAQDVLDRLVRPRSALDRASIQLGEPVTGEGTPSRFSRNASVATVIFPVSSARIRRATSWLTSNATPQVNWS